MSKIKTILVIDGMSCKHCAKKVELALMQLQNVEKVRVNLAKNETILLSNKPIDEQIIKSTIEALDYQVVEIKN